MTLRYSGAVEEQFAEQTAMPSIEFFRFYSKVLTYHIDGNAKNLPIFLEALQLIERNTEGNEEKAATKIRSKLTQNHRMEF